MKIWEDRWFDTLKKIRCGHTLKNDPFRCFETGH
jgi:hypothetical protein